MSRNKERPSWFKLFLHQKALVDSVPDQTAGKALKAVFQYFETRETEQLDPLSFAVFAAFKPYVDEAFRDFQRSSDAGKQGNEKRWKKTSPPPDSPCHPPSQPLPPSPEAEAEAKAEAEAQGEGARSAPPAAASVSRFTPPTVEEVAAYVRERGSRVDPQGFVDFYAAKGWMVGRNPMKDWKAACRSAERWERWQTPADTRGRVKTAADYEQGGEEVFLACRM